MRYFTKKIISFSTAFFMMACVIFSMTASAESVIPLITEEEAIAAAEWARNAVGNTEYHFRCPEFIRDAFHYGSGYSYWKVDGNAKTLADRWLVSSSDTNIPIGGLVFYDYFAELDGEYRDWGHVGIYIGDGNVVSALSKVTLHNIYDLSNCKYLGWGTYRGYNIRYDHGVKSITVAGKKSFEYGAPVSFSFGASDDKAILFYWLVIQNTDTDEILFEGSVPSNVHSFTFENSLDPGRYRFNVYGAVKSYPEDVAISFPFKVYVTFKSLRKFLNK